MRLQVLQESKWCKMRWLSRSTLCCCFLKSTWCCCWCYLGVCSSEPRDDPQTNQYWQDLLNYNFDLLLCWRFASEEIPQQPFSKSQQVLCWTSSSDQATQSHHLVCWFHKLRCLSFAMFLLLLIWILSLSGSNEGTQLNKDDRLAAWQHEEPIE